MAPEPLMSSEGKNGTKRSAPDAAKTPQSKKRKLPWPFSGFLSPGKEKAPSAAEPEPTPLTVIERAAIRAKKSPDWHELTEAGRIDAIHEAKRELESEERLRSPEQINKLDLQLDITPDDPRWRKYHSLFQKELPKESVAEVLNKHFEEGQKLAIVPPMTQGFILDIQNEHAEEYKKLLKGQLKGAKNNLITKLTMLHFGLPVEPLSLNNILNAGRDENDPEDAPEDLPKVQRIMHAEKPLEFLDLYHERSYGFPNLRRPKPRKTAPQVSMEPIDLAQRMTTGEEHLFGSPPPTPIFPSDETVSMRGGAGDPVRVYGLNGVGVQIQDEREDSEEGFRTAALRILGLPTTAANFEFVVDQYRNQKAYKDLPEKPYVKSFPVDQSSFSHTYNHYLKARLYNKHSDWLMVIRTPSDNMGPTFKIPKKAKKPAPPPPAIRQSLSPSKSRPTMQPPRLSPKKQPPPPKSPPKLSTKKTPPLIQPAGEDKDIDLPDEPLFNDLPTSLSIMAAPSPRPNERVVYSLDGRRSACFIDDHDSFCEAALKVINQRLGQSENPEFTVSQYNNAPVRECPPGKFLYIGSEKWKEGPASSRSYQSAVESVMFKKKDSQGNFLVLPDYHKEWRVVAHSTRPHVVRYWPQETSSDEMVEVLNYKAPLDSIGGRPSPSIFQPESGSKQASLTASEPRSGYIYGFAGKILAENTATDVKRATLKLLGADELHIYLRIFPGGLAPFKDVILDHRNFQQRVDSDVLPLIALSGEWKIFVSKNQLQNNGPWEPQEDKRDVVRLTYLTDTAYWKIPTDIETDYGINQLQGDFYRAMRVLFPIDMGRPRQNVHIGPDPVVDIGFGGMEVTEELWDKVRRDLENRNGGLTYNVNLVNVGEEKNVANASQLIGIRMVGSREYASAQLTDYVKMQKEIARMGKFLKDSRNPNHFRIWKTAEDWEAGRNSALLEYRSGPKSANSIKSFLEGLPGITNCIWFRPEFKIISVKDITGNRGRTVDWESSSFPPTFADFKKTLQDVFNESDPNAIKDIEINDVDGQHRFILSEDLTPSQWRKHIYDWFSGDVIMVQRNKKITYQVEQTPPWGVPEPKTSAVPLTTQSQNPTPTTAGPISPTSLPIYQGFTNNMPRINKERHLKHRVAPPKVTHWNEWSAESNRLDSLQQRSYHTEQSVIEPGQQPAPPIYGPPRQNPLSVGATMNMPEPYFWGTTPSDYARKADECQALRNSVLERMSRCQMCAVTFPEYETEKIAEHLKGHQDALRQSGKCPLCDCCWAALDKEQKKEHLWNHQSECEQDLLRSFWQGFQCPICDMDLQSLPNDDILTHMADHPPGLLRFCDRCGLDMNFCGEAEKYHHREACVEAEKNERVIHCRHCGKNRSHETEQDSQIHDRLCITSQYKAFCTQCALNMTLLGEYERIQHSSRCKPPGGPQKTFCKRCGKNLATMDAYARLDHKQECYMREPHLNDRERIEELEKRILEDKALRAHNNAVEAHLALKKKELDEREKAIRNHEAGVGIQVPPSAGLRPSSDTLKCSLLKSCGAVCNQETKITSCCGEVKAHCQHNCQPCGDNCGGSALQELIRRYPELKAGSDKMRAAAEKAKAQRAKDCSSQVQAWCGGNATDATSGTVDGEEAHRPASGNGKSPQIVSPSKPKKAPPKIKKTMPPPPADQSGQEVENPDAEGNPNIQLISENDNSESTGFERRSRKRKITASPRKVPGKTAVGSKRKKAVIKDNENEAGDPDFLVSKTPRGGKRQRTMRDASLGVASSVEGNEVSAQPVVVRRTTRATSGTPGPSMAPPVAKRAPRPRAGHLEEASEEEEAGMMRSPGKRGRPKSPKKGAK